MDRPRRIRFYNPASEPPPQPTASIPQSTTQRFNRAPPQPSAESTPVSRTTPETLRTLEANWRERRRAKLEDITLQRAMGVESPAGGTVKTGDKECRGVIEDSRLQEAKIRTRATSRRALEPVTTNLPARTPSDSSKIPPTIHRTEPSTRSRRSIAEEDHPTVTGNNTTSQGRANRARKIVKLVRDARLSVQPVDGTAEKRDSGVSSSGKVRTEKKTSPDVKIRCSDVAAPFPPSSSPTTAPTKRPPKRPETSATPRRVSEIRRMTQHSPESLTPSSKRSSRPLYCGSPSRSIDPQPITASPLPAREYSLSPTSSLVVYPYDQEWSIDPLSAGKRARKRPILSALTGMERMDMVDEGRTMRIKPLGVGEARYLDMREQGGWSSEDQRRWEVLGELVARLKSRTRRATYDFPQGTVHIMCNDPPDVVFYTTIMDPPASVDGKPRLEDGTVDTSALLSATTDHSYLCRARIIFSPLRHTLKISTHFGPSTEDPRAAQHKILPKQRQTNQSFRSRRIINLSSSSTTQQLLELYAHQKTAITQRTTGLKVDGKVERFPHEVWQVREVQSLGRFLKLREVWATTKEKGGT